MAWGNVDEHLNNSENSVRKTRKLLRELYKNLEEGNITKAKTLCIIMDKELLDSLSSFSEKDDGINAEGKPCKPEWMKKEKLPHGI